MNNHGCCLKESKQNVRTKGATWPNATDCDIESNSASTTMFHVLPQCLVDAEVVKNASDPGCG